MAINGATVGLKSVSDDEITFVTPPGMPITSQGVRYPYVVNYNGEVFRGEISFVSSRPDIFTIPPTPPGPNGRADVRNVSNSPPTFEPFEVTTNGAPTVLRLRATGILDLTASQLVVRIGSFNISGAEILTGARQVEPGVYEVDFRLAPQMAGAGDQPIILQGIVGAESFLSRLDDTAPRVLIAGGGAAMASISGRVLSPTGRGLANTSVTLTEPSGVRRIVITTAFGHYSFDNVPVGQTYVLGVVNRRFAFSTQTVPVDSDVSGVIFTPEP